MRKVQSSATLTFSLRPFFEREKKEYGTPLHFKRLIRKKKMTSQPSGGKAYELSRAIQAELDQLSGSSPQQASPITGTAAADSFVTSGGLRSAEKSTSMLAPPPPSHVQQVVHHSLVSSHNNSTYSTSSSSPPYPVTGEDQLRLQQLLRDKLSDSLGGSAARFAAAAPPHMQQGATASFASPHPLSFNAGGGAAKFSSLPASIGIGSSGVTAASPAMQTSSSRQNASRSQIPTDTSLPQPSHRHPSAANMAADEVFELRKALLTATATSEQLQLTLHTERQKILLLQHTVSLRDTTISDLERQLQVAADVSSSDRQKASEAERAQHEKIVHLHAEMERYSMQLRQVHQDVDREKMKCEALEQDLSNTSNAIADLSEENSLLRDFLKRRNIQYDRLKEFIVGPMKYFVDTAAKFQGEWGSTEQSSRNGGLLQTDEDDLEEDRRGAINGNSQHGRDVFSAINYQGFGKMQKNVENTSQRHRDESEAVARRVEAHMQRRNESETSTKGSLRVASARDPRVGNASHEARPTFVEIDIPRRLEAGPMPPDDDTSSSSASTSDDDDDDDSTGNMQKKDSVPNSNIHPKQGATPAGSSSLSLGLSKPVVVEQPTSPAWITSQTQTYHHTKQSSNVLSVAGKALMPATQSRIQSLYDPATNRELLTDEELERRVTALLARARSD